METNKERKWMTTEKVVATVMMATGVEHEFRLHLGGCLWMTLWMEYDTQRGLIGVSDNWRDYELCTPKELLAAYPDRCWES